MKIAFLLSALLLAALASGCGEKDQGPHLVVVNHTGRDLMEVQVGIGGDAGFGENALAAEYLADGETTAVTMAPDFISGRFALRAIDADGRELAWPATLLTNRQVVILDMPPASPE